MDKELAQVVGVLTVLVVYVGFFFYARFVVRRHERKRKVPVTYHCIPGAAKFEVDGQPIGVFDSSAIEMIDNAAIERMLDAEIEREEQEGSDG